VIALLAVLGAATGVVLGRSSIAEIDPIYFSSPESTRFFADLTAQGYSIELDDVQNPQEFWTSELDVVGRAACFGCRRGNDNRTAVASAEAAAVAAERSAYALQDPVPPAPRPATDLDRYMTFPISEEEAARERSEDYAASLAADRLGEDSYASSVEAGEPIGM
jgi:hypothetical protein